VRLAVHVVDRCNNIHVQQQIFIIFVDGIFTTLFEWLFTNVFDVTAPTQVIPCVYRGCNAD
jgi:hypothetical protein